MGFYPVPSSLHISLSSHFVWGLVSAGCRVIVLVVSAPCGCGCTTAFCRHPGGGTVPLLWWVELDLIPLITSAGSSGVFLAVCQPSMALGSLSANGWVCVTVLLVVRHESSSTGSCWPFGGARS